MHPSAWQRAWHILLEGSWVEWTNRTLFLFQVWPLEPDSVRTSLCPFKEGEKTRAGARVGRVQVDACWVPSDAALFLQTPGHTGTSGVQPGCGYCPPRAGS